MPEYLSPGVYIEEQSTGARPIEAVGMSVAGFVGRAPQAVARPNEPVRITSYEREFVPIFMEGATKTTPLSQAVQGFFINGGSACYVVNLGDDGEVFGSGRGLDQLRAIDDVAMVATPGRTNPADYEAVLSFAEMRGDCIALLDGPENAPDLEALTRVAEADDAAVAHPLPSSGAVPKPGLLPRRSERGFGAVYFPWLRVPDPILRRPDGRAATVSVPPCGHVAGMFARNDALRGVHKAPANMTVGGAVGLNRVIGKADQALLNPVGVNCFRFFSTEGTLLWGARTLAIDAEWRYVSVRRMFIMVEKSIERSTRWTVFEPNDQRLWRAVRRDITAFLTLLWRQKYLMGDTPEQAFFVRCDAVTNPADSIDAGLLIVEIGLAPIKPAEFVVFRIGQSQAGASVDGG